MKSVADVLADPRRSLAALAASLECQAASRAVDERTEEAFRQHGLALEAARQASREFWGAEQDAARHRLTTALAGLRVEEAHEHARIRESWGLSAGA